MIVRVARYRSKSQRKAQTSPLSVKVLKAGASQEEKFSETKSQPSLIVRQVHNVRPLTPAAALFAWNMLFQNGVA